MADESEAIRQKPFSLYRAKFSRLCWALAVIFMALAMFWLFATWYFAKNAGNVHEPANCRSGLSFVMGLQMLSGSFSILSFVFKPKWVDAALLVWNFLYLGIALIVFVGFTD